MNKLQSLLKTIEQQFGCTLTISEEDVIDSKELRVSQLEESRGYLQEQIDRTMNSAFGMLKRHISVVEPLVRMQEQIDKEIAVLNALPDPKPIAGMKSCVKR